MKKVVLFSTVLTTVLTVSALAYPAAITSAATVKLLGWDLVDGGKHMDYDGNYSYMSYVKKGAATWNGYKKGVIRPDSILVIQDVYCSDVKQNNDVNATTYSNGKMVFNKTNMAGLSATRKQNVATHELGHTLRLAHNKSTDVMYKYDTTHTRLSANDKASYSAAYKKY